MWIYIVALVQYVIIACAARMLFIEENKRDFDSGTLGVLAIVVMIIWPVFFIGTAYTHWRDRS